MPKKVFAVTNIKLGSNEGQYFAAGEEVDHTKFSSKAQLRELHEAGAVEIREVDATAPDPVKDEVPTESQEASTENPDGNTEPNGGQKPEGSEENE